MMAKVSRTLNLTLPKQGKYYKGKFHKRFVHLSGHTLMMYQDKAMYADDYDAPKHLIDLRGKNVKARATKVKDPSTCSWDCKGLVERFFVQVVDEGRDKVVTMLETKDKETAIAITKRLKTQT
jgi:hypothetical protein